MYLGSFSHPADVFMPGLLVCGLVSVLFAAAMFGLASVIAGGRVAADLQ
jgi:hypothetical protein